MRYPALLAKSRTALLVAMTAMIWLGFAPLQLGGIASYIIVIGNSMEPKFHRGDLIIAHRAPVYEIGDAVVYRNLDLKNFVFHRIISIRLGRYILRGDNNSWVDTYSPSSEGVLGRLWLHIPRGGTVIQQVRRPLAMALIAGTLGALFATSLFKDKAKGNTTMKHRSIQGHFSEFRQRIQNWSSDEDSLKPERSIGLNRAEIMEGSFFVLGLLALSSLILAGLAFSRPATRISQNQISYQHLGVISYAASAPAGVYDSNVIRSGDPIFTKITCAVDINFQYTLVAAQATNVRGTHRLTAIILEPASGWKRVVPLQEETAFTGTPFGTTARLDLCMIQSLTQSMEQATDFHPGGYTLVVTPDIKLEGELSGTALKSVFSPAFSFRYDQLQFSMIRNETTENPLAFTESGILPEERPETNTLLVLGWEVAIPALRSAAVTTFLISMSALILLGFRLRYLSRFDQPKIFQIKYGAMLVDVCGMDLSVTPGLVDVTSMDALAKLAERFGSAVLHEKRENIHMYYVRAGGLTYRFTLATGETEAFISEETVFPHGGAA
jgi:signal peptidase I